MPGSSEEFSVRSSKSPGVIKAAYNDTEAAEYVDDHWLKRRIERRTRRRQFGDVLGRVLAVACWTGENVHYRPDSAEFVGIDISIPMFPRARTDADECGRHVELAQMDAQQLTFVADAFENPNSSSKLTHSYSSCSVGFPAILPRSSQHRK